MVISGLTELLKKYCGHLVFEMYQVSVFSAETPNQTRDFPQLFKACAELVVPRQFILALSSILTNVSLNKTR